MPPIGLAPGTIPTRLSGAVIIVVLRRAIDFSVVYQPAQAGDSGTEIIST
jgi:hypothetical protein